MHIWKTVRPCAAMAALVASSGPAMALENASTHAALGFSDSLSGTVFPAGFYVRLDVLEYRSTRFNDQDGNRATANFGPSLVPFGVPPGTPGTSGPVNLKATGTYPQLTLFEQTETPIRFLGSDTLGFGATFLYGDQHVDLNAVVPVFGALGLSPVRDLGTGSVASLGDTAVFPLFLGWRFPDTPWSITANPLNFYVKTGSYDRNRAQNIGRNYNSWAPQLGVTYFDQTKKEGLGAGFEASVLFNYLRNGTNKDTNYRNGDEFFVSFGVMQWLRDGITKLGISGYYYQQISDDRRNGVPVFSAADLQPDIFNNGVGNRGQVTGLGPSIEWLLDRWTVNLHWQHEFQSRNMPQADRVWFKAAYAF